MTSDAPPLESAPDESEFDDELDPDLYAQLLASPAQEEAPRPINWRTLRAHEFEIEILDLNEWVHWLRRTYGLSTAIVPPFWHRHPELIWELSALRSHWLASFHPTQAATGPFAWHKEFATAQAHLRDWVAASGTRLTTDRPTRQAVWPGEPAQPPIEDETIEDREQDFLDFVAAESHAREDAEDQAIAALFREPPAGADPTA